MNRDEGSRKPAQRNPSASQGLPRKLSRDIGRRRVAPATLKMVEGLPQVAARQSAAAVFPQGSHGPRRPAPEVYQRTRLQSIADHGKLARATPDLAGRTRAPESDSSPDASLRLPEK